MSDDTLSRVLVLADHDQLQLSPSLPRLITAAQKFSRPVDIFIAAPKDHELIRQASCYRGISRLYFAPREQLFQQMSEDMEQCLCHLLCDQHKVFLANDNIAGREIASRLAASFDAPLFLTNVIQILDEQRFVRASHAGRILMEVELPEKADLSNHKIFSLRPSSFTPMEKRSDNEAGPELVDFDVLDFDVRFDYPCLPGLSQRVARLSGTQKTDLEFAPVVIGMGRGAQAPENLALIKTLAKRLGASLGGTRVAVELGMVPNNEQIGQTGKTIAPKLYIALGISGAVQHLAGIRDAQTIVAINKDPDAPIFKLADYGLVGDLREKLPELLRALDL